MKNRMLSIEEIKKGCEFAGKEWVFYPERDGGVSYIPDSEENSVYAIYIKDGVITGGIAHYELFLQRVIEGINRAFEGLGNGTKYITIESDFVQVGDIKSPRVYEKQFELCDYDIDQAKEQAIKYILDNL